MGMPVCDLHMEYTFILVATLGLGLGGCASMPPWLAGTATEPATVAEVARSARFELTGSQEVVGKVRTVTATHEDTLPILARRYGVGYDEIQSNPRLWDE